MMQLVRGYRGKLGDMLDTGRPFQVTMTTAGNAVYDTCCFGVDSKDKLSDDRYMVFYNQSVAPENAVSMVQRGSEFVYTVDLPKLPAAIVKLVFTVSIDGTGTMSGITEHRVTVSQEGAVCAELILSGSDFRSEKAIIDIEIYNKTVWRCSAVARGFDGGLAELLKHFGGEIAVQSSPAPAPVPPRQNPPRPAAPRQTAQNTPPPARSMPPQFTTTSPSKRSAAPVTSTPNYNAPRPVTPVTSTPNYNTPRPVAPVTSTPNYNTPRPIAPVTSTPAYNAPRPVTPVTSTPDYNAPRPVTPVTSTPDYNAPRPVAPVTSTPNYNTPRPVTPVTSAPSYTTPRSAGGGFSSEAQVADKLMKKISLSKDKVKLEKHVVNLSKCVVDLSKKSGVDLGNTRAKVVVALDYSGSMSGLYRNGVVQDTLNRLVPLGLTFDDNGAIDIYLFQTDFRKMDDLNLANYENYVNNVVFNSGYYMGGTNYCPVLKCIIEGCHISKGLFRGREWIPPIVDQGDPTFVLFITDGENADQSATSSLIRSCSTKNVFIQFIGIGNSTFRYLEALDDMEGRARDNTGFSRMADLSSANDEQLYTNVLEQFSKWLRGLQ